LAAEQLKLEHGYALAKEVGAKESAELARFVPGGRGHVSRRFISEIIESRLAEILEMINNELVLMGKSGKLAGGAVFTGGGAKLPGITDLARQELKLSSQVGCATGMKWLLEGDAGSSANLEDPEFVTALGLVLWGGDEDGWWDRANSGSFLNIKGILKHFMP